MYIHCRETTCSDLPFPPSAKTAPARGEEENVPRAQDDPIHSREGEEDQYNMIQALYRCYIECINYSSKLTQI